MRTLTRLLDIRQGEWARVVVLSLMLFFTNLGAMWSLMASEAAFLKSVPAAQLSLFQSFVIIGSALGSVVVTALYTAFADRVANGTLLTAIVVGGAAAFGVGLGLLALGWETAAYLYWYPLSMVFIDIFFNLHWATYVNDFYDTQTSKRLFPIIAASARVASIVAGVSIRGLNASGTPTWVIVLALMGMQLFVALLAWQLPRLTREAPKAAPVTPRGGQSFLRNIREGYQYVTQSVFLRWMAASTFLIYIIFALLTDQTNRIFRAELTTAADISNMTGLLNTLGNLLIFPIMLFALGRLIGWLGVENASLIFPFGTLGIISSVALVPGLPTAGLAHFDRFAFRVGFHLTLDSLLFNAVPLRVKARARAFMGGLVIPAGTICGGLLVMGLSQVPAELSWITKIGLLVFGVAYVGSMFMVRKQYGLALIKLLEQDDFASLLTEGASDLSVADPMTLNLLKTKLEKSQNPETTVFLASWLLQMGGGAAVPLLEQVARGATDARLRANLLEALVASGVRVPAAQQLYQDFLADAQGPVRQVALQGLRQVLGRDNPAYLTLAAAHINDPDLEVRLQVLPAVLAFGNAEQKTLAANMRQELLAHPEPAYRAKGVGVLGEAFDPATLPMLLQAAEDVADAVRLEVALVLETATKQTWAAEPSLALTNLARRWLDDPVERVREAALRMLRHLGKANLTTAVLSKALTDPSPQVGETAVETLTQVGRSIIPAVHPALLKSGNPLLTKMSALVLSRINAREFGALVDVQVTGNLLNIYQNVGYLEALAPVAHLRGGGLLVNSLREHNQTLLDELFYLLAARQEASALRVIRESFRHPDPRRQANAAEALETLTSPQTARLLTPLLVPDPSPKQQLQIAQEVWEMEAPELGATLRQLLERPDDAWWPMMTLYLLGEAGAHQRPLNAPMPTTPPRPRAASNPLDALLGGGSPGGDLAARRQRRTRPEANAGEGPTTTPPTQPPTTPPETPTAPALLPMTYAEIERLIQATATVNQAQAVQQAAAAALRLLYGAAPTDRRTLTDIEKLIFMREVAFFQGMPVNQLRALATVCEEEHFAKDAAIYNVGDPGGALYVVVSGKVALEREKQRKGSVARLGTMESYAYFGEMNLFDNSPRSATALALQDTWTLRLRREPIIAVALQSPGLSLELLNVLSRRLRETNDRIGELSRAKVANNLDQFFGKFDATPAG